MYVCTSAWASRKVCSLPAHIGRFKSSQDYQPSIALPQDTARMTNVPDARSMRCKSRALHRSEPVNGDPAFHLRRVGLLHSININVCPLGMQIHWTRLFIHVYVTYTTSRSTEHLLCLLMGCH